MINARSYNAKPKMTTSVLIVIGAGRSGTTLLGRALGAQRLFFNPGELYYVWDAGWLRRQRCSCNQSICACKFWSRVFEGKDDNYFIRCAALRQKVGFRSRLPQLFFPVFQGHRFKSALAEYRNELIKLYSRIAKVSGSEVIVDCSKDPAHALVLQGCSGMRVFVVHVVRDPRAVAFSRATPKARTSLDASPPMPKSSLLETAFKWTSVNALCSLAGRQCHDYRVVRYEELVENPVGLVNDIQQWVGVAVENSPSFELSQSKNHIALGNPDRMSSASLRFALDVRWRTQMKKTSRMAVSALTWPLRRLWGY